MQTIRIAKMSGEHVGLEVEGGEGQPLLVTRLASGSVALASGLLAPGDEILTVRDVMLDDKCSMVVNE